jgi:hypothetical protein
MIRSIKMQPKKVSQQVFNSSSSNNNSCKISSSSLNLFSNCILVFVNLQDKISNKLICNLSVNALWIHRESQEIAYVGFSDMDKASIVYNKLQQQTININNMYDCSSNKTSSFDQYQMNNAQNNWSLNQYFESLDNSDSTCNQDQFTFKLFYAAPFIELRYSNLFIPFTDIPKTRSCFLKVQASYRVSLNQWLRIFQNAFDLYRSADNSRVYIEFRTIEEADEARKTVHMRLIPFVYKDCIRNVLVSAVFVSKKLAMKKAQLFLSSTKNERIHHEENLSNKIVDWLYDSSC